MYQQYQTRLEIKRPLNEGPIVKQGGDLLSHLVPEAVPSVLEGLTSVFGMGTGVTLPQNHLAYSRLPITSENSFTTEQRGKQPRTP